MNNNIKFFLARKDKCRSAHRFINRSVLFDIALFLFIFFTILFGRWSSIVYPFPLNVDEAQAAANTLRITVNGLNWTSLDGTTVGPLNSLLLMWPKLLGLNVTLGLTRVTAAVVLIFVSLLVYSIGKRFLGRWLGLLCTLPLIFFYAFPESHDYLHYSSELLSLLLLVFANYLVVEIVFRGKTASVWLFFFSALLAGMVPFSKLQATPIAFVVGSFILILALILDEEFRWKKVFATVFGGILVALLFLLPLLMSGNLFHFWNSYVLWSTEYVKEPLSFLTIHEMIAQDWILKCVTYFMISICVLSSLLYRWLRVSGELGGRLFAINLSYFSLIFFVAIWVVLKPGNIFLHYLMFYPPFLAICVMVSVSFVKYLPPSRGLYFSAAYVGLAFAFVNSFPYLERIQKLKTATLKKSNISADNNILKASNIFSWLPFDNNYMLVWGWMPQWYLLSSKTPATRESHSYAQIVDSKLKNYFRQRFLEDIRESSPDYVIDAVSGSSFGFNDSQRFSPAIFPEFSRILVDKYTRVLPAYANEKCSKIYARNDLKEKIDKEIIDVKSVKASAVYEDGVVNYGVNNLFDYSVTEDACVDYWLLPDGVLGSVNIELKYSEGIRNISILNTRNGKYIDRSTKTAILRLKLNGAPVVERVVEMSAYPFWTKIDFIGSVQADTVEINVVAFNGLGGGLNEVVIGR
jgi:hypothetical protein